MSEKSSTIIGAIVGGALTLISTVFVGTVGYFNKNREMDIQMVNVGLSILRGEATGDKDTLPARRFALRLLKKYADVEIPETEFDNWAEKGATPYRQTEIMISFDELGNPKPVVTVADDVASVVYQKDCNGQGLTLNELGTDLKNEITKAIIIDKKSNWKPHGGMEGDTEQWKRCEEVWKSILFDYNLKKYFRI